MHFPDTIPKEEHRLSLHTFRLVTHISIDETKSSLTCTQTNEGRLLQGPFSLNGTNPEGGNKARTEDNKVNDSIDSIAICKEKEIQMVSNFKSLESIKNIACGSQKINLIGQKNGLTKTAEKHENKFWD